jgi:hypothetical protein
MRDFAKVSPLFWTRGSGRRLRGNAEAQLVGLYLLTCPSANMIGVYYLPLVTMAHETGLSEARTLVALSALEAADFAFYDVAAELVWVPNMAAYQLGDTLKEADKRRGGVFAELERVEGHRYASAFWARYGEAYSLGPMLVQEAPSKPLRSPFEGASCREEAPSKGKLDPREEKEKEKEKETTALAGETPAPVVVAKVGGKRGTRLPDGWSPSATVIAWAKEQGIADPFGPLEAFRDHWRGVPGAKGTKLDWDATYRNRLRDLIDQGRLLVVEPPPERLAPTDEGPIVKMPAKVASALTSLFERMAPAEEGAAL